MAERRQPGLIGEAGSDVEMHLVGDDSTTANLPPVDHHLVAGEHHDVARAAGTGIYIPDVGTDDGTLGAALAYAEAGLCVGPVKAGTKNPGSVLGDGWQRQTSRDPQVIAGSFAGTDHGVFIHAGRSGLVILDVDYPDLLPPVVQAAITECSPPYQTTRDGDPRRGHYLFLMPPGRTLGNGTGRLVGGWRQVRGLNGVIIAAPSPHENAADGGRYVWRRTGVVPVLPELVAKELPDATEAMDAATDAQVPAFLDEHAEANRPELLDVWCRLYARKVDAGESRHDGMVSILTGAMKEARAGYIDARTTADTLQGLFLTAVGRAPVDGGPQGAVRTGSRARSEWSGILAWAVAQAEAADLDAVRQRVAEKVPPSPSPSPSTSPSPSGKPSAATVLVDTALARYRLGVSDGGEPFAVAHDLPHIARLLRGGQGSLRAELADAYYEQTGKAAPQQALSDALMVVEGKARQATPERLFLRVAETDDGALWLDLGDTSGTVVKVTATGWTVVDTAPVLFHRTALTSPLPRPAEHGELSALWELLNVAESHRPLLAAYLVAALFPDISHPVVALLGEQGTGKTTAAKMLGAVLDPSPAQIRKAPRDVESWVTAASGSWIVALDNLSGMPDWLSDALCRAVTGDADVRRRLYTDGDLAVFMFRRVAILNGIDIGAVRDDLADRLLAVHLARISEQERRLESELLQQWQDAHPVILCAVLDLASVVLRRLPSVRLDAMPRMADFARVLAAVDAELGTSGLSTYLDLRTELAEDAVAGDPVLAAMTASITDEFIGTAADVLARITPDDPAWKPDREWPRSARALTSVLRRRSPSLRRVGWTVEDQGRGGKGKTLRFRLVPPEAGNRRATGGHGGQTAGMAGDDARLQTPAVTCDDGKQAGKAGNISYSPLSSQREREGDGADDPSSLEGPFLMPAMPAMPAWLQNATDTGGSAETLPTAVVGTCGRCQQPRTSLIGTDSRGRPACADCAETTTTTEINETTT